MRTKWFSNAQHINLFPKLPAELQEYIIELAVEGRPCTVELPLNPYAVRTIDMRTCRTLARMSVHFTEVVKRHAKRLLSQLEQAYQQPGPRSPTTELLEVTTCRHYRHWESLRLVKSRSGLDCMECTVYVRQVNEAIEWYQCRGNLSIAISTGNLLLMEIERLKSSRLYEGPAHKT